MPLILNGSTGISGIDGSAGTPSYQGTDSDTGLWYPAANTVALSTSGSERLRIDSSGNVGIGTSTITSSAGWVPKLVLSSTDAALIVKGSSGQENSFGTSGGLYIDCLGHSAATSNNIIFRNTSTNSSFSAVERMRIDSNGDVCVGTTSSVFPAANRGNITIGGSASSVLTLGTGTTNSTYLYYDQTGKDFYLVNTSSVGACIFYQSNAERMRISALGFLKASNTGAYFSPSSPVHELRNTTDGYNVVYFIHGGTNPYGPYMRFSAAAPNNTGNYYMYCDDTVAARFIIYANGNVVNTNGSYGAISDIKKKENIVDATPKLDDVMKLKVRNFNFKTNPDLKQIGFVAQELEEVFPSMVEDAAEMGDDGKPNGETSKTIKTTVLIPILVKAIQELKAELDSVKTELNQLKGV